MRISDWSSDVCSSDLQLDQLVAVFDAIEIDMRDGQIDLGRRIGLNDREGRARRLAQKPPSLQHRARQCGLARAETARPPHDIARCHTPPTPGSATFSIVDDIT